MKYVYGIFILLSGSAFVYHMREDHLSTSIAYFLLMLACVVLIAQFDIMDKEIEDKDEELQHLKESCDKWEEYSERLERKIKKLKSKK